jgi:serine/threonine protein kinase
LLCITSIQSIAILLNCSLLSTETLLTYVPDKILNKKLTLPPEVVKVDSVDYKIEANIGYGGNADVYKCIDEASGNEYAIKFQRHVNGNRLNRFKKENQCIYTHQHYHHNQYSLQSYNLHYPLLPLLEG